jgi:hypothetical protein
MNSTKTETLAHFRSQQVIFVQWMQEATAGLADTDLVEVTRKSTPFGSFVLDVRPAN